MPAQQLGQVLISAMAERERERTYTRKAHLTSDICGYLASSKDFKLRLLNQPLLCMQEITLKAKERFQQAVQLPVGENGVMSLPTFCSIPCLFGGLTVLWRQPKSTNVKDRPVG